LFKVIQRAKAKFSDYDPQIVYIVANKRINTRFYSDKSEGSRGKFQPKIDNPTPGSIVFEPLSTENAYDFHLVAHKVVQGTSTPTRYRIAYDASTIPQEAIAQFTYEQCYNYPNWFGSVRLPGCLQCADKLARMVGEHIKENPASSELLKTPFYL